ncbi:type I polyketide synthase [Sphingobium aromaticiconvertens]|uniref:type I polyketide synthase n=1 Tax=Sphingobium aromaticiconvertens TaxID=365341 RepID=UPI003018374A
MYHDPNAGNFDGQDGLDNAVAIVGMSCRFAQARGLDAYWSLLREGREAIERYSDEALIAAGVDPALLRKGGYVRSGAPLEDMECFDAGLFGLSPRDAAIMDPQHRHFLECVWEALENAGHTPQRFKGEIGLFAGSGHNAYMPYNLLTNAKLVRDVGLFLLRHTSNDKDFLTTRVSYLFDLKGPSINIQTACSTSLVSMHMAAQSLLNGECDMALAGGASIELPHRQGYMYEEGEILSPDGHCRPFDANAQGTVFGSGVGVVVLRRLADAIADGDHIYAVLRGSAINNDGAGKVGYLAPSVDGQAKVIAEALAIAGVDAHTIDYVEAHGTGTPVGDPIEVAALTSAFRQSTDRVGFCAIGSVKGNIGHTDTAAGVAGVIKVALALHHGELPATLNFTAPNPACALEDSPFFVAGKHVPWLAESRPRRAGVSSLGVGGTNAHLVLEQAPLRLESGPSRRRQLLMLSAKSDTALAHAGAALGRHLDADRTTSLPDVAYTLNIGRQPLSCRQFVVADDIADAIAKLEAEGPRGTAPLPCVADRPVAFLFCGAGPQHVNMARGLYDTEARFREEVDSALATAERIGIGQIRRWLFPVPSDSDQAEVEMARPSIALPALFIIQTALARLWMSLGVQPTGMIGHSSGEYAAAHIAGVIDLEAGLRIVSARGRLFETTAAGGMLSVPLSEAELAPLLPAELAIAAINAPGLCVVSGPADAIDRFQEELQSREIEAQAVRISVAAHSSMLDPILPEFRELMQSIPLKAPQIPFASNLTGGWVSGREVTDPEYWVRHLRETVRFMDGLKCLLNDPDQLLLEIGPGRSMASLARQHPDRARQQPLASSLRHPDQAVADDAFWLDTVGQLWAMGVTLDWDGFWSGQQRLRLPLPTYGFDRERHWIEPGTMHLAPQDDMEALTRQADTSDWQFEPVWNRTALPDRAIGEGPALVLEDDMGLGAGIAERLRSEKRDVVIVRPGNRFRRHSPDRFSIDPANPCDYAHLFDCLGAEGRLPAQIFHCWLLTGEAKGRTVATDRLLDMGLYSLTALVPELARQRDACVELALLSDHAQRIVEEHGLMPAKATAIGAARVISTEYPKTHIRCIDVMLSPVSNRRAQGELADTLLAELAGPWEARPICYRGGERWVLDYQPAAIGKSDGPVIMPPVEEDDVFLITGGLGGLGLMIARHLAETKGARIALLVRTALPPRNQWTDLLASVQVAKDVQDKILRVLALEASGAVVELFVADVANPHSLGKAIRSVVETLGAITGVFHTAGVLDDGLLETRTRSAMDAVLRPKVQGTLALEAALAGHPVEFMMLFSSVSALAGMPGQTDYAAANAFLDAYAQSRRDDPVTRVMSIGWTQWREVGMAAGLSRAVNLASGLSDDLGEGVMIDHPFLERLYMLSVDEYVVSATLSPETHWILDEHRLNGTGALLPGTSYLELARAAYGMVDPLPITLSDVTFLTPFAVQDGTARQLRVHLRRRVGSDWRFVILGRELGTTGEWVEHAVGYCCARPMAQLPAPLDIDGLMTRCSAVVGRGSEASSVLHFGPRWDNVQRIARNGDEALLHLSLDRAFQAECDHVLLHPALLDLATAGAQVLIDGYDPKRDFFAPFSYRWMTIHAPLPSAIVSHVRHRFQAEASGATATFDITIADPLGRILAEINEFTMMRISDLSAMRKKQDQPATSLADGAEPALEGILPEEGIRVIDQLLAGRTRPHILISPYDLGGAIKRLRKPHRSAMPQVAIERREGEGEAPVTAMEQVIAELWTDLLGVDPILREDNFFDLGGHSLLAVQFINRLRKKVGKSVPLAALLDAPTVAALAREIDPESVEGATVAVREDAVPAKRDLVTIRDGGSLTPIFFVHDGLGETLLYRGLALRLDQSRPIYGIEPLRTLEGGFAHTRISEMATNYIERLKTVQPTGPYLLAGLCAGGVIAFEMARQLQDGGDIVAFVGIIDAADVALAKRSFYITRIRLQRIRALAGESNPMLLLPSLVRRTVNAARWEISSRWQEARNRRTVQAIRRVNAGAEASVALGQAEDAIPFLKLYEVAHKLHQPKGMFEGGSVTLFKAMQGNGQKEDIAYRAVYNDYALGWGRRVADDITVVSVPGGHSSALQDPHVGTVARLFQEAIDSAVSSVERQASFTAREASPFMEVAAE